MIDPVTVSALLIGAGVGVIAQIVKLIESEIRRKTTSSCKEALSALKDTITRIQPILNDKRRLAMKKRRDKDSAVDDWFEKLAVYLNNASWLVEQTKLFSRFDRQIKTLITNLTEDIEKHLRLDNLVRMVQNEEILEVQQKILEEQRQINKALASSSRFADTVQAVHTLTGIMHSKQIGEPLASSSRFADTAKAADTPIRIMNSKKEDKPVTGNLSSVSSFQDQHVDFHEDITVTGNLSTVSSFQDQDVDFHLSPDRTPSYESTLELLYFTSHGVEEEDRTENPRIGRVLYDYAAVCDDELNLTAGEEVQIISEEKEWFCVLKKHPGRNSKMIGLVPMLCVNSS